MSYLDGEEYWEPTEHARRVSLWFNAECYILVQDGAEVAREAVKDTVLIDWKA